MYFDPLRSRTIPHKIYLSHDANPSTHVFKLYPKGPTTIPLTILESNQRPHGEL